MLSWLSRLFQSNVPPMVGETVITPPTVPNRAIAPIVTYYEKTAVIPDGGTTPAAGIDLEGFTLVGVIVPAGLEGTTLGFTVSTTLGGTYYVMQDGEGADLSVTVAASRCVPLSPSLFCGARFVKPVLATQTGAITLTFLLRAV